MQLGFGEDWSGLMESPKWNQADGRLQQIALGDHRMNINERIACVGQRSLLPSSVSSRESLVTAQGFQWCWWRGRPFATSQYLFVLRTKHTDELFILTTTDQDEAYVEM